MIFKKMKISVVLFFLFTSNQLVETFIKSAHLIDAGLSIEPKGLAVPITSWVTIPVVVTIPTLNETWYSMNVNAQKGLCRDAMTVAQMSALNKLFLSYLEESIPDHDPVSHMGLMDSICTSTPSICDDAKSNPPRKRRFIGMAILGLLGLSGTGMGIYNYQSINHLETKVDLLTKNQDQIRKDMTELGVSMKMILANEEIIVGMMMNMSKAMSHTIEQLGCLKKEDFTYQLVVSPFFLQASSLLKTGLGQLLGGRLVPALLGYKSLQNILKSNVRLRESIYMQDLNLFYELAHAIPVHMGKDPPLVSYIIQVPDLSSTQLSPIYEIANIGVGQVRDNQKTISKVNTPEYAIPIMTRSNKKTRLIALDIYKCQSKVNIYLCPPVSYIDHPNQCLDTLGECLTSTPNCNLTTCSVTDRIEDRDYLAQATQGGVWILSFGIPATLTHSAKSTSTYSERINLSVGKPRFFPYTDFTYLSIGGHTFFGALEREYVKPNIITGVIPYFEDAMPLSMIDTLRSDVEMNIKKTREIIEHVQGSQYHDINKAVWWKSAIIPIVFFFLIIMTCVCLVKIAQKNQERSTPT